MNIAYAYNFLFWSYLDGLYILVHNIKFITLEYNPAMFKYQIVFWHIPSKQNTEVTRSSPVQVLVCPQATLRNRLCT